MEKPAIVFSIAELRKYIFDFACTYSDKQCAEKGLWSVLQLRLEPNSIIPFYIWEYAFKSNAKSFLLWMIESGIKITGYLLDSAAKYGHLEIVKWLHENRKEGCTTWAMDWAAENGHLNVVIWLHENRKEGCTKWAMDWAAKNGHLNVVIWLHKNRKEGCTTLAMIYAAANGHLEIIIWLHENRTEGCTIWAMYYAEKNCHLNVVMWLHENRGMQSQLYFLT